VTTKEDAKRVFSAFGQNDARALSFVWLLCDIFDLALLRRSVELGFAFAQALLAFRSEGCEMFKFAQLSAAQGERDGFYVLAVCFHNGYGCEVDLDKTRENFLLAKIFCSRASLVMSLPWIGWADSSSILIHADGFGGAERQSWEAAGILCRVFRSKSNCSILDVEVRWSCLQLDKLCMDT